MGKNLADRLSRTKKANAELSSILPFKEEECVPYISRLYTLELPYINCCDTMTLHEAVSDTASKRGTKTPACCREMTLDEIEKELGYKVKIINKESKS